MPTADDEEGNMVSGRMVTTVGAMRWSVSYVEPADGTRFQCPPLSWEQALSTARNLARFGGLHVRMVPAA